MKVTVTVNGQSEPPTSSRDFYSSTSFATSWDCEEHTLAATPQVVASARFSSTAPVKSCTMFAVMADGRSIQTVEGMASNGQLHPMQRASARSTACSGFCTPAMMLVGSALLQENPNPSEEEIRWAISGNLACCTGYQNIAVQARGRRYVPAG